MINITGENSKIRANSKSLWTLSNANILFVKMGAATPNVPKPGTIQRNIQGEGVAVPSPRTSEDRLRVTLQATGDGGTGTFEYLCAGARMSR